MVEHYEESSYRYTDPIRFFKANDPYYFEVDNIPLKQLQENCNWLKDQVREVTTQVNSQALSVSRPDIEELRPYATGGDRVVRVKPGRYSARINDASEKTPLAYLRRVMGSAMGNAVGEVDAWELALPNPGDYPGGKNAILESALNQFKSSLSQDALGMTGLVERAFTWPVVNSYTPVNHTGVVVDEGTNTLGYAGPGSNIVGGGANYSPMVITQALLWAKSLGSSTGSTALPSFETTNPNSGFAKFPRTESFFIKRWRGVARLSIVDIPSELNIEVPTFDPEDFMYINEDGNNTPVPNVQSRVDMIFIYSKPVDMSGVNILQSSGKQKINAPQLGIVRGAGIRANLQPTADFDRAYIQSTGDTPSILASPGDQNNQNMGFTAASGNDIEYDIRGSFPSPDDILNLAPLISEQLEENAYELVGQSIMPVAYVWVQNGSVLVSDNDVVDIRPFFRTAELAYNERAGVAAAFPQLSLANPAVGKGQLDREVQRLNQSIEPRLAALEVEPEVAPSQRSVSLSLATGYVFGGYNFGPEGAIFHYREARGDGPSANIRSDITSEYAIGKGGNISIPFSPQWDVAEWAKMGLDDPGLYPNDYINSWFGSTIQSEAGSNSEYTDAAGLNSAGEAPATLNTFKAGTAVVAGGAGYATSFNFISKRVEFLRPDWLVDYQVDVSFLNCLPQSYRGGSSPASWSGYWVEKGWNYFIIYVAFPAFPTTGSNGITQGDQGGTFPAPFTTTIVTSSTKKKKTSASVTISARNGGRFSAFVVPVEEVLTSNPEPYSATPGQGYLGNPRMGLCTYPTVQWEFKGVTEETSEWHYGDLNQFNDSIVLMP